jgi:hypothetical protein
MRIPSVLFCLVVFLPASGQTKLKTENVILITLDGMRWQEVFGGADSSFMSQQKTLKDPQVKQKFWRESPVERRRILMNFLWTTVATHGQLYGNRAAGSKVNVTNNQWFSYPGYNELLTGFADNERIHSNEKFYNPNKTVLEFINEQSPFKGKVAAFTSWDVFPFIINDKRSGVFVSGGLAEARAARLSEREKVLNQMMSVVPNPLGDVRLDAFTFYYGLEYLKKSKPRLFYFSFDETDDFAHQGEYAAYLNSAHNTDKFINELWSYIQTDPTYQNKTTMIITCDHGRGADAKEWKDHGAKVKGADQIWLAVIGPDTPPTGEAKSESQLYQNQIAKTIAQLLGYDYKNERPVGEVISTLLK